MSQCTDILRHLGKGRTLTPMQAFKLFNCLSLSQRITELKAQRWPIVSRIVKVGEKRVAEYSIPRARRA